MRYLSQTFLCLTILGSLLGCGADMPTRDELAEKFPDAVGSDVSENEKVLCPFLRMIERAGLFADTVDPDTNTITTATVINQTAQFGCDRFLCSTFANAVALGQPGPGGVNIEALHTATGISHECGFTFAFGGSVVDDFTRQQTLDRLYARADENENLVYEDILAVKLAICAEQGVEITAIGEGEAKLIFAYLGGMDRGFVAFSDVEKFFHAELPESITLQLLTQDLLSSVDAE